MSDDNPLNRCLSKLDFATTGFPSPPIDGPIVCAEKLGHAGLHRMTLGASWNGGRYGCVFITVEWGDVVQLSRENL